MADNANRSALVPQPNLYIGDLTGRPLDYGMVYFGEPDKDPEFYQIEIFADQDLTVPLAQPVRTKGGYLYDKGDVVRVYSLNGEYSVKVKDQYNREVYYVAKLAKASIGEIAQDQADYLRGVINTKVSELNVVIDLLMKNKIKSNYVYEGEKTQSQVNSDQAQLNSVLSNFKASQEEINTAQTATNIAQVQTNALLQSNINSVSGGYIGAFATLSDLQAKTGMTTGQVAKVMNDTDSEKNGDYRYDGTSWVKGYDVLFDAKTYTDNAIELTKNSNLVFKVKLTDDTYIDHTSGLTYAGSDAYTTDYIVLNPQKHYTINQNAVISFAFYDANKSYVADDKSLKKQTDFKLPINAKYIRVSFKKTDINTAYLYAIDDAVEQRHGIDLFKSQKFTSGIYVNQENGGSAVADWASVSEYLPILSDRYYRINQTNYTQYAFYDERLNYIADTQSVNSIKVFKTPSNAKYLRITVANTDMSSSFLKLLNPNYSGLEVTVGSGVADFDKLQDAIVFANAQNKNHTIKIAAGTYVEELQAISETLAHSFIGADKDKTIICDVAGGASFELLKVSGGYFENLTISRKNSGYAIHADYAKEGDIEFFNCKIKTISGSVLGAGSHQNQTLRLRNCQLYQKGATIGTGIMYWHNNVNANTSGQRLEMFDCDVYGDEYVLRIDDANKIYSDGAMQVGNATCLFVKNTFWSTNTQKYVDKRGTPTAQGAIVGNIILDPRSHGNNIAELNA